ncbi:MAG: Glycosyltransferase/rhamnosyltransferase [Candidatus Gottesmanbacteria bacterium GW2011_GWC2_39_8]|uniref:Glycosyltransferase/rhamnosyltransferase n=1 Tax=Candidatus Gottesmanbacteria bacterium GW2011_GWC2_39_8 TaxID=1618450 RepID=A0A0G0SC49_9BACT|nr:MAG: Glycosyltransferase/rhamnosyltransferase [Candidatus Gottesmanbacteria bacterium GW2011_GWC2_39_8]
MIRLSVIIVSFNTKTLLSNCLSSLVKYYDPSFFEVIVVDNNSTDGSPEMVVRDFPQFKLIKNNENKGYAKANNTGIYKAKGKFILLLNSDTEFTDGNLSKSVRFMEDHPKTGALGVKLINADGSLQYSAGYFPVLVRVFFWMFFLDDIPFVSKFFKSYHQENPEFYSKIQNTDWVTGAFFLFNRDIITKSGLIDEKIFMYGEEVEWCYRIKKSGYKVCYYPEVKVMHLKGASGVGITSGLKEEYKSLLFFYKKHMPVWKIPILIFLLKIGAMLRIFLFGIIYPDPRKKKIYEEAFRLV